MVYTVGQCGWCMYIDRPTEYIITRFEVGLTILSLLTSYMTEWSWLWFCKLKVLSYVAHHLINRSMIFEQLQLTCNWYAYSVSHGLWVWLRKNYISATLICLYTVKLLWGSQKTFSLLSEGADYFLPAIGPHLIMYSVLSVCLSVKSCKQKISQN